MHRLPTKGPELGPGTTASQTLACITFLVFVRARRPGWVAPCLVFSGGRLVGFGERCCLEFLGAREFSPIARQRASFTECYQTELQRLRHRVRGGCGCPLSVWLGRGVRVVGQARTHPVQEEIRPGSYASPGRFTKHTYDVRHFTRRPAAQLFGQRTSAAATV